MDIDLDLELELVLELELELKLEEEVLLKVELELDPNLDLELEYNQWGAVKQSWDCLLDGKRMLMIVAEPSFSTGINVQFNGIPHVIPQPLIQVILTLYL